MPFPMPIRLRASLAPVVTLCLASHLACVPSITERCWLVVRHAPPPSLPGGFAELDALLLRRATDMTLASRGLNSSLVFVFHKDFAEVLLPSLCERLERARALAMAGRIAEAGKKYQALLVSSQVLAYAVAIQSTAQYADRRLQPGGQISSTQVKFASEAEPILTAALSEDPREIERVLDVHPEIFADWAKLLEEWPARIDDGAHKAEVAKVVWDIAFLVVATYQAADAAAEIAAGGRPPIPPMPAFATAGGALAANSIGPTTLEMAEVLRKLLALGVLDVGVVAALSHSLGGGGRAHAPAHSERCPDVGRAPGWCRPSGSPGQWAGTSDQGSRRRSSGQRAAPSRRTVDRAGRVQLANQDPSGRPGRSRGPVQSTRA
jgi:hypothetical protein